MFFKEKYKNYVMHGGLNKMDKLKKALPFIIPPLAVLLIMGFAFYRHGLYPFGDGTVSWCDMSQQVIPLLTDFKDIFTGKFKWSKMNYNRNLVVMLIIGLIPLFLLFLPIPGTDMKLKDLADRLSASPVLIVTACSLILTSVLLTIGIIRNRKSVASTHKHLATKSNAKATRDNFNVVDAILVGVTQVCAALLPGLSRSGSTLSVGEMRGISKQKALDYTFVLGIPSILAAALLEGVDAIKSPEGLSNIEFLPLIIGMAVSAVVGYLAIVIFKWFLKSDKMEIFVIYTAVVGVAFIVISIIEMNTGVNLFTGAPIA